MKVSICVAQYNRAERIKESINSLLNQAYDDFEVVVVNDGSTDPLVQEYLDAFTDSKLTVIEQKNTGFVGAMRKAIETATGDYIAIHGAGDVSLTSRIAKQAAFLDNNKKIGAVGCFYQNCIFSPEETEIIEVRRNQKSHFTIEDFAKNPIPFGHGEVMYRRSLYNKIGGYRPFFKFAQDHDLWLRMSEHCDMALIPEVLYQRGYFKSDGIATNIDKLVVQKLLSHFAIQLYEDRKNGKSDLIELHGNQAGLFRQPSADMAQYLSWKALSMYYQKNTPKAIELIKLSIKEKRNLKNSIVKIFLSIGSQKSLNKICLKIMQIHPRSKKWLN